MTLPGAVFIIPNVRRLEQQRLFAAALDWVAGQQNPGNILLGKALNVTLDRARQPGITSHDLPRPKARPRHHPVDMFTTH
jgi:hypothetical protein